MFATLKISKRHVAKSLSWRVIGSLDTLLFAWLVTGNFSDGLNDNVEDDLDGIGSPFHHLQSLAKPGVSLRRA